jgi:signal transduction histidine kinase
VSSAIVLWLSWGLRTLLYPHIFQLFLAAVVVSAWYGGFVAGLLTMVMSTVAIIWLLSMTSPPAITGLHALIELVIFIGLALGVCWLVGALRDARVRAEAAHASAHAALGVRDEFIALVTHELKTPLTVIKASAQVLARRGTADPSTVSMILSQTNRLERLINDLLDAARADAAQLRLRRGWVDLVDLTELGVRQAQYGTSSHCIWLDAPPGVVQGYWDSDRLAQVLQNLLSNAIKYSPDGGVIMVRIEPLDRVVKLSVTDSGRGIEPEALPHLFERFYRTDKAASIAQGLGLGLYITRHLVEAHGGNIGVTSQEGFGSAFTVSLPYQSTPG